MWTARCDYVTKLHTIDTYTSRQHLWLDVADQLVANGTLTCDHPHNPLCSSDVHSTERM
jgi:hypothetical protein